MLKSTDLKLEEYGARPLESDGALTAIILATEKTMPVSNRTTTIVQDGNVAMRATVRVVNGTASLAYTVAMVQKDPDLTPGGQQRKLKKPRDTAIQIVGMATDSLKDERARLAAVQTSLYGVPPPKDVSETLIDIEIRTWLRGQETANMTAVMQRIADGDLDGHIQRILTAILRSPVAVIPGALERVIQDAWRNAVANAKAPEVAALNTELENLAECEQTVATCVAFVKSMCDYNQLDLYAQVRRWGVGAVEAFGYSPTLSAQLDLVLSARAA